MAGSEPAKEEEEGVVAPAVVAPAFWREHWPGVSFVLFFGVILLNVVHSSSMSEIKGTQFECISHAPFGSF